MKTISIRGIDPELARKLKQAASEQSKSLNQLVLDILRNNLDIQKEKKYTKIFTDLDHLFGSWSAEEFNTIQNKINHDRKIDKDLWHE